MSLTHHIQWKIEAPRSNASQAWQPSFFFSCPLLGAQHLHPARAAPCLGVYQNVPVGRSDTGSPQSLPAMKRCGQSGPPGQTFRDIPGRSQNEAGRGCARCGSGLTRLLWKPERCAGPGENEAGRHRPRWSLRLSSPGGAGSESSPALEKGKSSLRIRISSPASGVCARRFAGFGGRWGGLTSWSGRGRSAELLPEAATKVPGCPASLTPAGRKRGESACAEGWCCASALSKIF